MEKILLAEQTTNSITLALLGIGVDKKEKLISFIRPFIANLGPFLLLRLQGKLLFTALTHELVIPFYLNL